MTRRPSPARQRPPEARRSVGCHRRTPPGRPFGSDPLRSQSQPRPGLARSGKREEALQEQAEIHRLNERNANIGRALILLETAATKLARDQRREAIADLREATTLAPDFAEAQYQLGVAAGDETRSASPLTQSE